MKHIVRKVFLEDWAMKLVALVITLGFAAAVLSGFILAVASPGC